jgi:hypothetical protein
MSIGCPLLCLGNLSQRRMAHPHKLVSSGNQGDFDKAIYGFKIYKISIITIRIIYHQIKVDINPWPW